MTKVQLRAGQRLRPGNALHGLPTALPGQHNGRRGRHVAGVPRRPDWRRSFMRGLAQGGIDQALEESGKTIGDAIRACLAEPAFRAEIDRITAERLAAAEHKLVDALLRRLDKADEAGDKSALAIWQALTDEKRRPGTRAEAPGPAERRGRRADPAERAALARKVAQETEEFDKLLEAVRKRLAAVEQRTGEA